MWIKYQELPICNSLTINGLKLEKLSTIWILSPYYFFDSERKNKKNHKKLKR